MLNDIKSVITRSGPLLLQDLAGAATLILVLAVALHIPSTF
jgi:hypothetical protein